MRRKILSGARWLLLIAVIMLPHAARAEYILFQVEVPVGGLRNADGVSPITSDTGQVQLINAGPDRQINPPRGGMNITGDDVLLMDRTGERFDQPVGYSSSTRSVSLGNGAVFFHGEINVTDGDRLYLRVWDNGAAHYGNSETYLITFSMRPTYGNEWSPAVTASCRAAAPFQPLAPGAQALYDETFVPRLTVTFNRAAGNYDICQTPAGLPYVYNFYQNADGTGSLWSYSASEATVTITASTPGRPGWLFEAGSHSVKTRARNWFGTAPEYGLSPESPWTAFRIIGAGGGQAVYNLRVAPVDADTVRLRWQATSGGPEFDLYRTTNLNSDSVDWGSAIDIIATADGADWYVDRDLDPATGAGEEYWRVLPNSGDKNAYPRDVAGRKTYILDTSNTGLGVNSLALPFSRNWDLRTGSAVATAAQLEAVIPSFEFLGGWNAASQSEYSYLAGGARGTTSFDLQPGVGYQLSLGGTAPTYSWTVIGIK